MVRPCDETVWLNSVDSVVRQWGETVWLTQCGETVW